VNTICGKNALTSRKDNLNVTYCNAHLKVMQKKDPFEIFEIKKEKKELVRTMSVLLLATRLYEHLDNLKDILLDVEEIIIENQPVLKNPTMKTVQILLFATLRDFLSPVPWVGFVHAGKKVQGKEKGDAGYSSRKKGSEDRVKDFFEKSTVIEKEKWMNILAINQKKSDLCDALCMCLDQLV
jgi:hypothetical protein